MTNINGFSSFEYSQNDIKTNYEKNDIELEDISILYTTEKQEDERTTFEETFNKVFAADAEDGQKFLNGLIENKASLMKDLGLTDDQYDSLACISLALASQETGMGYENGYNEENSGLGGIIRKFGKWVDTKILGGTSASSGMTQMKIYDFLNEPNKLSEKQCNILKEYGITADGVATNNLYSEPDKAAIATMVALTAIAEHYDDYKEVLSSENKNLEQKLNLNSDEEKASAKEKGDNIIFNISGTYENASDKQKAEIRRTFKQWLLSINESKKGNKVDDNYNEEIQLENLNKLLGGNPKLNSNDLDYIRYTLTSDGAEMNITEYCAYAWNKGTGETGMQLDRLLADKIGTILSNPEDFDYDQFTVNVSTLAEMYANQSA